MNPVSVCTGLVVYDPVAIHYILEAVVSPQTATTVSPLTFMISMEKLRYVEGLVSMDLGDIGHPHDTIEKCSEHYRLLTLLKDHEGWTLLCDYFSDSAKLLEADILGHAIEPNAALRQEFMKGRAQMLRAIPAFLDDYRETLMANIKHIQYMLKDDEDARRDSSFDYRIDSAGESGNGASAP